MSLHPALAGMLESMQDSPLDISLMPAAQYRQIADSLIPPPRLPAISQVDDVVMNLPQGEINARLYKNTEAETPVVVYFHGGGWVCGNLDTHDALCRRLAELSGVAVLAVDYRLAPEHPFPAAAADAYAACVWVAENAASLNVNAEKMAVAGDSAGGNLAISACLQARAKAGPAISLQCLFYPVCDASLGSDSYREYSEGYFLTAKAMEAFWRHYGEQAANSPLASIALNSDFSNLPPAFISAAQYDVLRDEALVYAEKLRAAGVPVESDVVDGMIHGFASFQDWLEPAAQMLVRASAAIKKALL